MNRNQDGEKPNSRHSATDAERCIQMSKKYGWKLLRIEPSIAYLKEKQNFQTITRRIKNG
ncbi:MAG: hypothetical protein F6K35_41550 [Okeania sp. SIO2H7]|nr:hypothetical protein [Okeania sp. SIO2H7]